MKKNFTLLWLFLSFATLCMPVLQVSAQTSTTKTRTIKLTFAGRGESKTVDDVLVENLSNGLSVQMDGKDTLVLNVATSTTDVENVYYDNNNEDICIFDDRMLVSLQQPGEVQIYIYGLNGTTIYQTRMDASSGYATVSMPQLPSGVYMIRATAPGFDKSVKWISGRSETFSISAGVAFDWASTERSQQIDTQKPMYVSSNMTNCVQMNFTEGDVIRFTGTSGNMTTIYTLSPRTSHPVYFDFFRCQDADGYNYTIVRAGDLLWMAEDLHRINNPSLTYANYLASDALAGLINNPEVALVATDDNTGQAYYSKAGAIKALPEGWRLPTQGELDYAIKEFNGGDYSTAGRWMKNNGFAVDSTSLRMSTSGCYNGSVINTDSAYLMTRSTLGGVMLVMQMNDANDNVAFKTSTAYLIPVRGVRQAPSAYNEMMETFGYINNVKQKSPSERALDRGPLGKTYTMYDMGQSIAFDYSSGQYNSTSAEPRSGIIYKDTTSINWKFHTNRNRNFLSDRGTNNVDNNVLRKMAAMNNGAGTQCIVEMQWSRLFRIITENNVFSDHPSVFSYNHEDGVYITIADDESNGYSVLNPQTGNGFHKGFYLPLNAYIKCLTKYVLNFTSWSMSGNTRRRNEARMDYLQRIFQLLTADFNQDGVDDLVICIDGEVWVYDGNAMLTAAKNGTISGSYTEQPLYHKNFNMVNDSTEKDASYCSINKPVTRFAVGDVNGDEIPDIVVLQVGVTDTTDTTNLNGMAELMLFQSGNVEVAPMASRVIANNYGNAIFCDVKVGNVSNSKYDDIILFFRNYTDANGFEKQGRLWRTMYDPSEANGQIYAETDSTYIVNSFRGDIRQVGNNNVTLAHLRGNGYPYDIVVGADMWKWSEGTEKLEFQYKVLPYLDNQIWSIYADNIIAADPEADGRDALFYFHNWSTYEDNDVFMFQGLAETYFDGECIEDNLRNNYNLNGDLLKYCNSGSKWGDNWVKQQLELMWWYRYSSTQEWASTAALCAVQARKGPNTKKFQYKGYQMSFSEPRIHALIAAPPTYTYGENEISPDYDFVTQWGYSRSNSMQTTSSSSISSSIIVGFEAEINAPITGTKLGGVDFTIKMQNECTNSTSHSNTVTYSQLYEARDDDRVVLQTTPYDTYTYEVVESENVDEIGNELILSVPMETMTVGLALTDYDRLMADAKNVPNLHEVFSHTIGDPFSYPKNNTQIKCNVPDAQILWGNGKWDSWVTTGTGGSVIREIALDESSATSAAFTFSMESELVVSSLGVKAGAGFGYSNTNETTHEESSGFTVSACVPGLASGDNSGRKFFDWNLCWYKYTLNGQTFPVVNYIVKKR